MAIDPNNAPGRWTEDAAGRWYAEQPWLVGANYINAGSINQLEMWQQPTFRPQEIDIELGWAAAAGMNVMRVFLHDLVYRDDAEGFLSRIREFLEIADRHGIRVIPVLFDSCWDPLPQPGPQHPPIPGVHNSGWVQSPGEIALHDPAEYPRLQQYVAGVVSAFRDDKRIVCWDIWNEPDNTNTSSYGRGEASDKSAQVLSLLPQAFAWARAAEPTQPLTTAPWIGDWHDPSHWSAMTRLQLQLSDIISFHNYGWVEEVELHIHAFEAYRRPLLCTEYMARGAGNTIDAVLSVFRKHRIAAIHWGLVKGKTQTTLPWDSWQRPYTAEPPVVWHHDIFWPNGWPYRQREIDILRAETGRGGDRMHDKHAGVDAPPTRR